MAWIDRLREWIRRLVGAAGADAPVEDGPDPSRLDPDNVTEVRTEADDDPVERLREVERRRSADDREGEPDEDDGQPKG